MIVLLKKNFTDVKAAKLVVMQTKAKQINKTNVHIYRPLQCHDFRGTYKRGLTTEMSVRATIKGGV